MTEQREETSFEKLVRETAARTNEIHEVKYFVHSIQEETKMLRDYIATQEPILNDESLQGKYSTEDLDFMSKELQCSKVRLKELVAPLAAAETEYFKLFNVK